MTSPGWVVSLYREVCHMSRSLTFICCMQHLVPSECGFRVIPPDMHIVLILILPVIKVLNFVFMKANFWLSVSPTCLHPHSQVNIVNSLCYFVWPDAWFDSFRRITWSVFCHENIPDVVFFTLLVYISLRNSQRNGLQLWLLPVCECFDHFIFQSF